MNSVIFRQADARWGSLPYPTKAYSFAHNGCGCCAVTHCAIEIDRFKNFTPADVRKFMVQFATKGHGTLWAGISKGLANYRYAVHWRSADSMKDIFKVLETSLKRGVILFGSTKGPDKTVWTTGGHYIAFVDYKVEKGKHYFYLKDSGGRHHDKWWCYETSMKGDVRQVWICTGLKELQKPAGKYTGEIPEPTLKKGSAGPGVRSWQKFLNWYGAYGLIDDGKFGDLTASATKDFQASNGLSQDGVAGPKTMAKAKEYTQDPTDPPSKPPAIKKCVDVSYWQGKISVDNWRKILKTCEYAICRASYTSQSKFSLNKDSTFAENFTNAKAAGLKVGAYHYSQAITVDEARAEAEYLCNILKNFTPTFYVVCDFEFGGRLSSKIGKKASDIANAFCDVIKARGYLPCIYANTNTLNNYLTNPKYPVWVAQYASSCTYKGSKVMWQYTSSGKIDGIDGKADLSYVYEDPSPEQHEAVPEKKPEQVENSYVGVLPSIRVKKTTAEVIADALKWGKWIADNNVFHYGEYGARTYVTPGSKHYENGKYKSIYNVTHSCGCHFCGTNKVKKNNKATKLGFKGENWEHTYVCNTFVTAIYAHGGMEPTCLSKCRNGKCVGMNEKGRSPALDASKNWTYMGKLAIKNLQAGDVLVSKGHMQCVYAPVSNSKVKIIEATSYVGKYKSAASNNSIRVIEKKPSYTSVYRFTGKVDADIPIRYGEYSARVVLLQKFLKWAGFDCGEVDGKFGERTKTAVEGFQKGTGLAVDGVVGSKTIDKMEATKK